MVTKTKYAPPPEETAAKLATSVAEAVLMEQLKDDGAVLAVQVN